MEVAIARHVRLALLVGAVLLSACGTSSATRAGENVAGTTPRAELAARGQATTAPSAAAQSTTATTTSRPVAAAAATPTLAPTQHPTLAPTPTPTLAPTPTPTPTLAPTSPPTPQPATPTPVRTVAPVAVTAPPPAPVNTCGAAANPWGYTFCGGSFIASPAGTFCSYFNCIASFWNGTGYVMQCADATFSKSGGKSGSCSSHGGNSRALYSP